MFSGKRMMMAGLCLLSALAIPLGAASVTAGKKRVGVLSFTAMSGAAAADTEALGEMFRSELVQSRRFNVLDRANMDTVLKEQAFQQTGCTESACAVKIGKLVNVEYMMFGTLSKLGSMALLTVNVVNVESGEIAVTAKEKIKNIEQAEQPVRALVDTIAAQLKMPDRIDISQKRDEAFSGMLIKGISSGVLLAGGVTTWLVGDAYYNGAALKLNEYNAATTSSSAENLHGLIVSQGDLADMLYLVSESALVLGGAMLAWGVIDFFFWKGYNDQITASVTPTSVNVCYKF
ncbi:MAG: hypothetical protein HZC28_15960 [Spirochaetes bacterium]|nr:hypothetical protein [Spirochaetota bacterium]